eukprot:scaffold152506_cov46-Prasinocladus_malaysianus.AAC.1
MLRNVRNGPWSSSKAQAFDVMLPAPLSSSKSACSAVSIVARISSTYLASQNSSKTPANLVSDIAFP